MAKAKAGAKAESRAAASTSAPEPDVEGEEAAPLIGIDARLWSSGPHAEEIGDLEIPSGEVMVCDAGTLFDPVEVSLPKGVYQVRVARSDEGDNASAVLIARDATPVSWEDVGAYGVDAGMSGFFDADVFGRVDDHRWPVSLYDDLISKHLDPAEERGHAGAFVPYEEAKFSACRSGHGDGVYPVYVGRDAKGAVVAVLTTFLE
jgi:hypothetical protein